ncbi:MAG TPA: CsgG/HfaB family protein, partial [Bacteroidota bacterium]|nr:CsgG/HfaB family protein [Bacteroidota bacterium]
MAVKSISVFLLFVLFAQCGTTMIVVPVMRPAEVNLGKLKKIAVGRVSGEAARDVEDDLIGQLIESQTFDVLDRSNLDKIIREYRLSMSELMDEKTALQLGNMIGAAALIF